MPLEGTTNWRSYVTNACQTCCPVVLLVQFYQKSQVNEEPEGGEEGEDEGEGECGEEGGDEGGEEGGPEEQQEVEGGDEEDDETHNKTAGVVDEGEQNPEVLRQYEREVENDERALEEDSSDDEDDEHVPRDWQNYDFSQLTVNAGEHVP